MQQVTRVKAEAARAVSPEEVLAFIPPSADLIMPLANGEPATLLDCIEEHAEDLHEVRIHQMHALRQRRYIRGEFGHHLRHVSYFLSPCTRQAFLRGQCELVPSHFSDVPMLLEEVTKASLVIAAASPMDRHGYFSLGTNADYTAAFIGRAPFFLEVNPNMPRTFGRNQLHVSQVLGYCEADYQLVEHRPAEPNELDWRIGAYVAERIPDGATLQAGIGAIPNATVSYLRDHRNLGLHTELFSDGLVELVEQGVITGTRKTLNPGKMVTTFALGTRALYEFLHENTALEFLPVQYVNDPRVIAQEGRFVSINATTEVDFLGQCASETIAGRYWSGSGGQADFARGAMASKAGKAFVVLHSATSDESLSRIRARLTPGSAVTTSKNTVDNVVTEWGVAELRGRSISQRTRALIRIAHPKFRDDLEREAMEMGFL